MNMYKIKWTRLQAEIFRLFCIKAGQALSLRAAAKALKVSPTAVSHALPALVKAGLLTAAASKTMNLLAIELNRDNPRALHLKRAENLRLLYESSLPDFLYHEFPGCAIIVFGSYSRGEDVLTEAEDTRSDLDVAVIGSKEQHPDLARYEERLERRIHLTFFKSWRGIHKHLRDSILSGLLLSGGVDV